MLGSDELRLKFCSYSRTRKLPRVEIYSALKTVLLANRFLEAIAVVNPFVRENKRSSIKRRDRRNI